MCIRDSADTGKLSKESLACVDPDKIDAAVCKGCFNFVALIFAHEAVIHKNTGQLAAHSFCQQGRSNGTIHTAGES